MSGQSSVGESRIYEAGDQRNDPKTAPKNEQNTGDHYHQGKENSHQALDSKDERSIANKLARESKRENEPEPEKSEEARLSKKDSTLPAKMHGNEPSKGAKVDQQLEDEEAEILKKKGAFGPQ